MKRSLFVSCRNCWSLQSQTQNFISLGKIFFFVFVFYLSMSMKSFRWKRGKGGEGHEDIRSCRLMTLKNIFPPSQDVIIVLIYNAFMIIVPVLQVYDRISPTFIACSSSVCSALTSWSLTWVERKKSWKFLHNKRVVRLPMTSLSLKQLQFVKVSLIFMLLGCESWKMRNCATVQMKNLSS